jgi:hypothetical protein
MKISEVEKFLQLFFEIMQDNREAFCKMCKVPVSCKNGQIAPDDYGADQEIRVRPLNSLRTAQVKELSGRDVIIGVQGQVVKSGEMLLQALKL